MWCQYNMVAEANKDVSKIKLPPKSNLLEWIKAAQEKIDSKGTIVSPLWWQELSTTKQRWLGVMKYTKRSKR